MNVVFQSAQLSNSNRVLALYNYTAYDDSELQLIKVTSRHLNIMLFSPTRK